ncbi:hypothetical protein M409DRAFT_60444 [Zasmidium cellare ATCC 36951]|uniref:Alpha/beta hydrolase fold-3 domain-containing protein n=1 Tax=Zasmidium cellare ATCC 36951 TaxID=1080233 RepID=A0A6A6C298_ZASCE|nr:uncharacterized protein M409DRAFT_60444 [Zasmidium cellare ATCC 36951]KAF2159849.1 hypothetical protein M409DRAFT_60444 [Zasmidium cellare ATCC 36951]
MPFQPINTLRFLASWFQPISTALFHPTLPWTIRWRLLLLQPLNFLVYTIKCLPYAFSNTYESMYIPTRDDGRRLRIIVFRPKKQDHDSKLRPLHLDFHAGGFIGGIPEVDAPFCEMLCERTGAVVVSASYRLAPRHSFPAAHEDAEDVLSWLEVHAQDTLLADFYRLTVSGFSAGGNLMYMAGSRAKAAVGFYAPVDFRRAPWEKPHPPSMPKNDPMKVFLPLMDVYAGGDVRKRAADDERLHPILRRIDELPANLLHVVPGIDVIVEEQMAFVERVREDFEWEGKGRRAEVKFFKEVFHGWLELPKGIVDEKFRTEAFEAAVAFIRRAQEM